MYLVGVIMEMGARIKADDMVTVTAVHRRAAENIAQTQRIDPIRRGRLLCNRMNRRFQRRIRLLVRIQHQHIIAAGERLRALPLHAKAAPIAVFIPARAEAGGNRRALVAAARIENDDFIRQIAHRSETGGQVTRLVFHNHHHTERMRVLARRRHGQRQIVQIDRMRLKIGGVALRAAVAVAEQRVLVKRILREQPGIHPAAAAAQKATCDEKLADKHPETARPDAERADPLATRGRRLRPGIGVGEALFQPESRGGRGVVFEKTGQHLRARAADVQRFMHCQRAELKTARVEAPVRLAAPQRVVDETAEQHIETAHAINRIARRLVLDASEGGKQGVVRRLVRVQRENPVARGKRLRALPLHAVALPIGVHKPACAVLRGDRLALIRTARIKDNNFIGDRRQPRQTAAQIRRLVLHHHHHA